MDDLEKGAIGDSPAQNKGAEAGSPPVENVIGEFMRKNGFYDLKDDIADLKETITSLKEQGLSTKKQEEKLDDMQDEAESLVKKYLEQEHYDKNTKAHLGAVRKLLSENSKEVAQKVLSDLHKQKLDADFDVRDDFLAEKAKENGISVRELKKVLGEYSEPYSKKLPSEEAKLSYRDWVREKSLSEREAKLKQSDDAAKNLRESGGRELSQSATRAKDFGGENWSKAKTREEKLLALHDL